MRPSWTPEQERELRLLWQRGLSASKIGKVMGFSREAVLGKCFRLGLKHADRLEVSLGVAR